jgi:hypothetical protein
MHINPVLKQLDAAEKKYLAPEGLARTLFTTNILLEFNRMCVDAYRINVKMGSLFDSAMKEAVRKAVKETKRGIKVGAKPKGKVPK